MTTFSWHRGHAPTHRGRAPSVEPFWQVLSLGVITVLFGIAVLAWPGQTLHLLGVLAGVWLIVLGVSRAVAALGRTQDTARRVFTGFVAAVLIVAGIACVRNAAGGVLLLATILGLAWLLSGFTQLAISLFTKGKARIWLTTLGVLSILVGLAFMLWPGPSLTTLVLLTGISALIIGAGEVAYALQLRRGRPAVESGGAPA
ncbi:HdeD family acid-resistance protein [Dactylosporangium fulvum]